MDMFLRLAKLHEEQRVIYARAVCEEPDRSNEVVDYGKAVEAFQKWSNEMKTASGGKSLGNVRIMHQPRVAGRVIDIVYKDEERAIDVAIKVDDPQVWEMCKTGAYTGLSIGGSYGEKWSDPDNPTLTRYAPKLSELSIVDRPCVPSATFQILKADGTAEERRFLQRQTFGALFKRAEVDANLIAALRTRVVAHNEAHGETWQKTKLGTLKKVWERGAKHGDASMGMRRVETFLEALSGRGALRKDAGDYDLLPPGHPGREKPKTFAQLYKADRKESSPGAHAGAAVTGLAYGYVGRKVSGPVLTPVTATLMAASNRVRRGINRTNDAIVGFHRGVGMATRSKRPGLISDAVRRSVRAGATADAAAGPVGRAARSMRGVWRVPGTAAGLGIGYMAYRRDLNRRAAREEAARMAQKADGGGELAKNAAGTAAKAAKGVFGPPRPAFGPASAASRIGKTPFRGFERAGLAITSAAGAAVGGFGAHKGNPYRDEKGRYTSKEKAAFVVGTGATLGALAGLGGGIAITNYGIKRTLARAEQKLAGESGKLAEMRRDLADYVGESRLARALKGSMEEASSGLDKARDAHTILTGMDATEFMYRRQNGIAPTAKLGAAHADGLKKAREVFAQATTRESDKKGIIGRALTDTSLNVDDIMKEYVGSRMAGGSHDEALGAARKLLADRDVPAVKAKIVSDTLPSYIEARRVVRAQDAMKEELDILKGKASLALGEAEQRVKVAATYANKPAAEVLGVYKKHLDLEAAGFKGVTAKGLPKDVKEFRRTGAHKLINEKLKALTIAEGGEVAKKQRIIDRLAQAVEPAEALYPGHKKKVIDTYISTRVAAKFAQKASPMAAAFKEFAKEANAAATVIRRGAFGGDSGLKRAMDGAKMRLKRGFAAAFLKGPPDKDGKLPKTSLKVGFIPVTMPAFSGAKIAGWAALGTLSSTAFLRRDQNGKLVTDKPKNLRIHFGEKNREGNIEFLITYESSKNPGQRHVLFGFDVDPKNADSPNFKLPGIAYGGGNNVKGDGARAFRGSLPPDELINVWKNQSGKPGNNLTMDIGNGVKVLHTDFHNKVKDKNLREAAHKVGNSVYDILMEGAGGFRADIESGKSGAESVYNDLAVLTGQTVDPQVGFRIDMLTARRKIQLFANLLPNHNRLLTSLGEVHSTQGKSGQAAFASDLEKAFEALPTPENNFHKSVLRGIVSIAQHNRSITKDQANHLNGVVGRLGSGGSGSSRPSGGNNNRFWESSGDPDFDQWLRDNTRQPKDGDWDRHFNQFRSIYEAQKSDPGGDLRKADNLTKGAAATVAAGSSGEKKGKPAAQYYGTVIGGGAGFEAAYGTGNYLLRQPRVVAGSGLKVRSGNTLRALSRGSKRVGLGVAGALALGAVGSRIGAGMDRRAGRPEVDKPDDTTRQGIGRIGGSLAGGLIGGAKLGAKLGQRFGAAGLVAGTAIGGGLGGALGDYSGAKIGAAWDRYSKRTSRRMRENG